MAKVLKPAGAGFVAGAIVAVLPLPLNLLTGLVLLGWWGIRCVRREPAQRTKLLVSGAVGIVTVVAAMVAPLKQLDEAVGPFRYANVPLPRLCELLWEDHRVMVRADRGAETTVLETFASDGAISRREVLRKLARETGCELRIGYCGTGSTFLFGSHPCFTRLRPRNARREGAEGPSAPSQTETYPTGTEAGANR